MRPSQVVERRGTESRTRAEGGTGGTPVPENPEARALEGAAWALRHRAADLPADSPVRRLLGTVATELSELGSEFVDRRHDAVLGAFKVRARKLRDRNAERIRQATKRLAPWMSGAATFDLP
jgi:hypothetical protein